MDILTTNKKVISEKFGDLYIGKIKKVKIYSLRDVCKSLRIYVKDGMGILEKRGIQPINVMVKRRTLYKENKFIGYNGLMEILLASHNDISSDYKAWVDAVPDKDFKQCSIYKNNAAYNKRKPKVTKTTSIPATPIKESEKIPPKMMDTEVEPCLTGGIETFFKEFMSMQEFCWNLTSLSIVFTHEYVKGNRDRLFQASKITDFITGFQRYLKNNYEGTELYRYRDEDFHWREKMKKAGLI